MTAKTNIKAGTGRSLVIGVPDIDRKLKKLPAALARKTLSTSMRESMRPVLTAVREETPVGETGQLRRAIRLRVAKTKRGNIKLVVMIGEGFFVGKTFYGSFVELGAEHIEARLFMTRVYERMKAAVKRDAIARISSGLDAAIKGL